MEEQYYRHGMIISCSIFNIVLCSMLQDHVETGSHDTHTVLDRGYLSVARRQSAGALKTIEVCHTLLTSPTLLFAPGGRSRGLILHED